MRTALPLLLLAPGVRAQCPLETLPTPPQLADASFAQAGHAVATDGVRLAVATPFEVLLPFMDPENAYRGVVWIHEQVAGEWALADVVQGTDFVDEFSVFGWDVAIDGDVLLVGMPGPCPLDCLPGLPPGRARFYEHDGSGWQLVLDVAGSSGVPTDSFGAAVALDGDRALIGAPNADRVYVFERSGGTWQETAILEGEPGSDLGRAVDLEGNLAVAGALLAENNGIPTPGQVYVYEDTGAGFVEVDRLAPPIGLVSDEQFGFSVGVSVDRVAVGSPRAPYAPPFTGFSLPAEAFTGGVFVYERSGEGFTFDARLGGVDPQSMTRLGSALSIEGDLLLVGAERVGATGEAHLFERTALGWAEIADLDIPDPDPVEPFGPLGAEGFGQDVALAGGVLVIGAPGKDVDETPSAGAAYAGELDDLTCTNQALLAVPRFLSLSAPARQVFRLDAGESHGGGVYLLVGTASGTSPALVVDGLTVALVPDAYTTASILGAGSFPFLQTLGALDSAGRAIAALELPAGLPPSLAGLDIDHLFVSLVPEGTLGFVSPPAPLELLP